MSTFESLEQQLNSLSIEIHASELHGILMGHACGLKKDSLRKDRRSLYREWLGVEPPSTIISVLESAYAAAIKNLDEYSDFEFRLLLPIDETPISERVYAVALWCSGFLFGMETSGRSKDVLGKDVVEALNDLKTIAEMEANVPEGEKNEVDLAEIEEFVRVIVLTVFADVNSKPKY